MHADRCVLRNHGGQGDIDLNTVQLKRDKRRQREKQEKEEARKGLEEWTERRTGSKQRQSGSDDVGIQSDASRETEHNETNQSAVLGWMNERVVAEADPGREELPSQDDGAGDPGFFSRSTSSSLSSRSAQQEIGSIGISPIAIVSRTHKRRHQQQQQYHIPPAELAPNFSSPTSYSWSSASLADPSTQEEGWAVLDQLLTSQRALEEQLFADQCLDMALLMCCQNAAKMIEHPPATFEQQQREVAQQLQTLLRDLYNRYGMDHPVFRQRVLTHHTIKLLFDHQNENTT